MIGKAEALDSPQRVVLDMDSTEIPVYWHQKLGKEVVFRADAAFAAASWRTARRAVAKVEFHFGELFPRVGFIVTNLETESRPVVRFYKRGTAEQWIKEGKQAVKMTRLSCHRLVFLKKIENWSLTSPQRRLFGSMVRRIAALPLRTG